MSSTLKYFGLAALAITGIVAGSRLLFHSNHDHVYINKKDIKDGKYMFYTSDGVFEDVDSWKNFKWNSSDYYNDIKEGQYYDLDTWGWRFGLTSSYPNIIDFEACTHKDLQKSPQPGE